FFDGYWWLALPYAGWAAWHGIRAAGEFRWNPQGRSMTHALRLFALGYWATGAAFAVMYLANWRPIGFDPVMVSLTAAHFHIAGFVMTVLAYYQLKHFPGTFTRMSGTLALIGMPLVASGITQTQLGGSPVLEQFGAAVFVFFALTLAIQQIRHFKRTGLPVLRRWLWLAGALCLFAGAGLAAAYALRFQWPIDWVNIPNMKYWHGTLNTLGFAWLSLLGCESART
ncbi:MAG: YndJ family transporter, partial [Saprospiraceae bacterium]|nr:YndJ family transporter [Saprospiraceae bacterium]